MGKLELAYVFFRIFACSLNFRDDMLENPCLILRWRKMRISGSIKEIAVETILDILIDQERAWRICHIIDLLHILSVELDHHRLQFCSRNIHDKHEAGARGPWTPQRDNKNYSLAICAGGDSCVRNLK